MQDELIISGRKIMYNIRKNWYWCIIPIIAAVLIATVVALGKAGVQTITTDMSNQYYQSMAYVLVKWAEPEYGESESEIYEANRTAHNSIMNNLANYVNTTAVTDKLNEALQQNEYSIISSTDVYGMSIISSTSFSVSAIGVKNPERVKLITQTLIDILLEDGPNQYGLGECQLTGGIGVYNAVKGTDGRISKQNGTLIQPQTIEKRLEFKDAFFTKRNVMVIMAGAALGLGLLLVFIITDSRVYTRSDLRFINAKSLGEYAATGKELELAAVVMSQNIKNNDGKSACVVYPNEKDIRDYITEMSKLVCMDTIEIKNLGNIIESPKNTAMISRDDAVIIVIKEADNVQDIKKLINIIDCIGGKIIGYIMISCR